MPPLKYVSKIILTVILCLISKANAYDLEECGSSVYKWKDRSVLDVYFSPWYYEDRYKLAAEREKLPIDIIDEVIESVRDWNQVSNMKINLIVRQFSTTTADPRPTGIASLEFKRTPHGDGRFGSTEKYNSGAPGCKYTAAYVYIYPGQTTSKASDKLPYLPSGKPHVGSTIRHELGHLLGLKHEERYYNSMGDSATHLTQHGDYSIPFIGRDAMLGVRELYGPTPWVQIAATHFRRVNQSPGADPTSLHDFVILTDENNVPVKGRFAGFETSFFVPKGKKIRFRFQLQNLSSSSDATSLPVRVRIRLSPTRASIKAKLIKETSFTPRSIFSAKSVYSTIEIPSEVEPGKYYLLANSFLDTKLTGVKESYRPLITNNTWIPITVCSNPECTILRAEEPEMPAEDLRTNIAVRHSQKCVEIGLYNTINEGDKAQQWQCLDASQFNQNWVLKRDPVDDYYQIVAQHSGQCLESDINHIWENGASAQQGSCNPNKYNQKWAMIPYGLKSYLIWNVHSGKCLDVEMAYTTDGARMQQWDCHAGPNQQFLFSATSERFHIIAQHTQKCVDVALNPPPAPGDNAQQWACLANTQLNQQFKLRAEGPFFRLIAQHTDQCLEVDNDHMWENGADVQQNPCMPQSWNQLWYVQRFANPDKYTIVNSVSGKCMDVEWAYGHDGARMQQWDCHGGLNQQYIFRAAAGPYEEVYTGPGGTPGDEED